MSNKVLASAVIAALLTMSGSVFAQSRDDYRDGHRNAPQRPSAQHDHRDSHGRDVHSGPPPRGDYGHRYDNHGGRGAGPQHSYYRGGYIPARYRHRQYVIDNWRAYHLYAPPRGYSWVQTGSDFVLVAIATGLIAQIILNN